MVKIKMKLSLIFSMCFLAVLVFGDLDSSTSPNPNSSSSPSPVESFKGLEDRIRELEKSQKVSKASHEESQEELQNLKTSFEKSQEEIKSLKEKVEKLEQEISQGDRIGLLRPPVRGPPGRKGETGQDGIKGETGNTGGTGIKGEKGDRGQTGSHGQPGVKGEIGPAGPKGDRGVSATQSLTSCRDAMEILPSPRSQKQMIHPYGNKTSLEVLCDFEVDGGGWTVIQKRSSGPQQEFNRTWTEYENGFGSLDKNFWIGLKNIHALTKNGDQELRIQLEDFEGEKRWAKYSSFSVSNASDFYRLSISGYDGDAMDDMSYASDSTRVLNGMQFSTPDKDNDNATGFNCATYYSGSGWWFNSCFRANLNGLYREKGETFTAGQGVHWASWKGYDYSLAKTEMKIRTRK